MNIGQASNASGVSAKMIRYYEAIGLISPPLRTQSNYRVYSATDVHTLRFVKRAKTLGFSVEETATLLGLWQDKQRASGDVKQIAQGHITALEDKIEDLQGMVRTLRHLAHCCHGNARPDCPILDDLAGSAPAAKHKDASHEH